MPAKRRVALKAATPPPQPLDGCVVTLSGNFKAFGHNQTSLEDLVNKLGGSIAKSVTAKTTHVASGEDDFFDDSTKVAKGKALSLPIVSPQWILDSEKDGSLADAKSHTWYVTSQGNASTPARDAASGTPTNGAGKGSTNGTATTAKKRPVPDKDDTDGKKPKAAKTRQSNGKAAVKDESEDEDMKDVEDVEEEQVAEGQFLKKKGKVIELDELCPLSAYQVYVDDDGMIWDASLNQSNATANNNKFYRVQIAYNPQSQDYKTWTRWGRVGESGQFAILGDGDKASAIKNFEKKFRDKSGLSWEKRGEDPKPGKYAFVERSYNSDDDEDDEEAEPKPKAEGEAVVSKLEKPVQDLMTLIFNQGYFQAAMSALNYDSQKLPLGKLSKNTITRGFQQLKDLAALMNDPSLASSRWNMTTAAATEHLSNTYYSVIPHAFGRNRPPIINDGVLLKKEIELLESLSDMKDASDIMKVPVKDKEAIHALDRQFQGLGLKEMTVLDRSSTEFTSLATYLNDSRGATHNVRYEVQQIFRIERQGEFDRFNASRYAKMNSDRRLLWHGSRCTNYGGILSQGLRIAPPEAPVSGYMFGKGIYLADMSSKSANYCVHSISGGHALLLLCEAELGDPMHKLTGASYSAGEDAKANGMVATWGQGRTGQLNWIDAECVHESLKGIKIPDPNKPPGQTSVQGASLFYNEFICYDVAQVKLRYLLRVKM